MYKGGIMAPQLGGSVEIQNFAFTDSILKFLIMMLSPLTRKAWTLVACLTLRYPGVLAQLDKPIMSPAVPFDQTDPILYEHLNPTPSTYDQWEYGWLPLRCKAVAENEGLSPYDIDVFNVHYEDCDEAWVLCRHHDAQVTLEQLIDNFGRLPVRLRNIVRHQFAIPSDNLVAWTYSDLGDIVYSGDIGQYIRFWIHEAGHAVDRNINPSEGDYSSSDAWITEYNKDNYIADAYAQNNMAENFAQEVIVALFDKVVPGGIGSLVPNWGDIFHQYATIQAVMGDMLIPGGTCNRHFPDDSIVCMGPDAGCESKRDDEHSNATETEDSEEPIVCTLG
ncbi:uncharacterized protein BJX67DRAFT_341716 [Aspergillus lucknowensis]|uniref:Conidiation-specific protein 13 n=1 Tax=Aspergillus lucknowensis TaxID=176173 RepID=A0ABR4M6E5_9EURO